LANAQFDDLEHISKLKNAKAGSFQRAEEEKQKSQAQDGGKRLEKCQDD